MSGAPQTGRTINGHTYTDAPVDVKLGPNTFRIPANYLDSQIAPWPGEGVTLVIEWPDMKPTPPGARANPRTNDFRKEIAVRINYIDRIPIETSLSGFPQMKPSRRRVCGKGGSQGPSRSTRCTAGDLGPDALCNR
jgi:hypothetical protein